MSITSPQPELKVCFVWGSVSGTHLWTCHWVDCLFFRHGVYAKILKYFGGFVFVCTCHLCIPKVARCAQPLNYPVPVRNMHKHPAAQHEQRNFYISLRSAKAENRWFLTTARLADLSVAPRLCGQLSTTETTPQPGCASLWGSGFIMLSPTEPYAGIAALETAAQQGCPLGLRTEDTKLLFHAKLECPAEEVIMLSSYPPTHLFFFFLSS